MKKLLLLGQDAPELGVIVQKQLDCASACLSVGAAADSPSLAFKGDRSVPNEDALLVVQHGRQWLLAVADGHYGHFISHALIEYLAQERPSLPTRLGQLALWLAGLELEPDLPGGSTLLVACLSQDSGEVFGFSFGDCSLVSLGPDGATPHNRLNENYIRAGGPLEMEQASPFQFKLAADRTLLLFSDGVNECCYRDPHRSVQLSHLHQLWQECQGQVHSLALQIAQLALDGVDGNAGGQDNLALIAWKAPKGEEE